MIDITPVINNVISNRITWFSYFDLALDRLKYNGFVTSFWPEDEHWATIMIDNVVAGYLWHKYPLLIGLIQYSEQFWSALGHMPFISVLQTHSLKSKDFSLEYDQFRDIFEFGFDYSCFSAEDLWFFNNSI